MKFIQIEQKNEKLKALGVINLVSESGVSWIDFMRTANSDVYVVIDDTNMVVSISNDITSLCPIGMRVLGFLGDVTVKKFYIDGQFYDDGEVVFDGGLFRVANNDEISIHQKTVNKNKINNKVSYIIESKYPIWKQMNIIRAGGMELLAMSSFIDALRDFSNSMIKSNIKYEDINWIRFEV